MLSGSQLAPSRLPKVPLWRRGAAFGIDFFAAAFLSALLSGSVAAQAFVFGVIWMILRAVVPAQNHGQSLGRWALDMRVIGTEFNRATPGLKELARREAIAGVGAMLALVGLASLSLTSVWGLLLFLFLAVDCGVAWVDPKGNRAVHDQIAKTLVVPCRRGYSLDIKIRQIVADVRGRVRR